MIGKISLHLAALTQVNTALRARFPDILAGPISEYGIVKPHFNFVSRHVSSLPFLIELRPRYC